MILNIFLILMECDAEENISGARMDFAQRLAFLVTSSCFALDIRTKASNFVPTSNAIAVYCKLLMCFLPHLKYGLD